VYQAPQGGATPFTEEKMPARGFAERHKMAAFATAAAWPRAQANGK